MQAVAVRATTTDAVSASRVWGGRIISGLAVLFLVFDGAIKVLQLAPAVEGSAQLGYSASVTLGLGVLELVLLALYVLPRTAVLGALLLTGYLGGAVATHVRAGSPTFSIVFPIIIGAMVWGGLALRDARLARLLAAQER